jgi:hypothetical protein
MLSWFDLTDNFNILVISTERSEPRFCSVE